MPSFGYCNKSLITLSIGLWDQFYQDRQALSVTQRECLVNAIIRLLNKFSWLKVTPLSGAYCTIILRAKNYCIPPFNVCLFVFHYVICVMCVFKTYQNIKSNGHKFYSKPTLYEFCFQTHSN
jgi:hypothetical protein